MAKNQSESGGFSFSQNLVVSRNNCYINSIRMHNIHHRRRAIPAGVRLITFATTIRWIGWGFFEALLPIFIFSFADSYAETGLFSSVFDVMFLISLPAIGALADKVAAKTLIIIGLAMYPFIGIGYFLAGATGIAAFIVLTKALNGTAYALDSVGRSAYFMRHVPKDKIATAFGYFESMSTFWWILAVLSSIFLIKVVEVHWLFLLLIPSHLIAIWIISKLRADNHESMKDGVKDVLRDGAYASMIREIKEWGAGLKLIGFLVFFLSLISPVIDFFIPILTYADSASIEKAVLIAAVMAIPAVFGAFWGKIADRYKKNGIFWGLGIAAFLIFALGQTDVYIFHLGLAFLIKCALEVVNLASDGITTRIIRPEHYGRLSGAMQAIGDVGSLIGPISLGLLIDQAGASFAFTAVSIASIAMLCLLMFKSHALSPKEI
ncbi:MAG: hypothetical protein A3B23_02235 [Candidatus Colwellbacteria bacterium RIFCSPLOWO2_01_FULL_48_10]|uniref:Major facilitator superfamily (MFS) profile domain-containing protein n=1 Tax=Candidatus Colwellbacteria bacterium RIFCSPLOWO2_01_FULL_48_10 TaxID=1797690 RepID=A0A1G1Z5Q4_9BACT|nr:MAG: hypothetical protein A3B23_02235 [Candidatus Colwellbacteria bacterium RIFCSPLOWO2_01_FULL_48_10]